MSNYKLVIHFTDGTTMPIEWKKGAVRASVKAAVRKLLAFRIALRERAVRKSAALPLRRFTVDFYVNDEMIMAGVEAIEYSPKNEILEDSLSWLIDRAYDAAGLADLKSTVGAPVKAEMEEAQAN